MEHDELHFFKNMFTKFEAIRDLLDRIECNIQEEYDRRTGFDTRTKEIK